MKDRHEQLVAELPELTSLLKGTDALSGQMRRFSVGYLTSGNSDDLGFLRFYYGARVGRYLLYKDIGSSDASFDELIDDKDLIKLLIGDVSVTRSAKIPRDLFQHQRWLGRHEARARPEYLSLSRWCKRNPETGEKRHPFHTVLQEKLAADGMADWPRVAYLWREGVWGTELFVAGPSVFEEQEFRNWIAFIDIGKYR